MSQRIAGRYGLIVVGRVFLSQPPTVLRAALKSGYAYSGNGFFNPAGWRDGTKATMDCLGGRLDVNAQPVTIAIEQTRFAISFILRKPWIDFDPTSNLVFSNLMWTKWAINGYQTLNKRNKDALFGFGVGELVCDGVNISSLDAQFSRCEVSLVWDEWGHFDQSAWGIDGTVPDLNDDPLQSASPDRPVLVAETVFWTTSYHEAFELATTDFPPRRVGYRGQSLLPLRPQHDLRNLVRTNHVQGRSWPPAYTLAE
jgi:hypothetical protein